MAHHSRGEAKVLSLVTKTAFAACCSGVALATVCGLLMVVPRWSLRIVEELPERHGELRAVHEAYAAGQAEGELLRYTSPGASHAGMSAARRFDDAVRGAARVSPDPDRERTVTQLTTSLRRVSQLDPGHLTVVTLAAERDRQLEAWWRAAETDVIAETVATLRPMVQLADVGTAGGLLGLVLSLWVSAALIQHIERVERRTAAVSTGAPSDAAPIRRRPTVSAVPRARVRSRPAMMHPAPPLSIIRWTDLVGDVLDAMEPLAEYHGHELHADVGPTLDAFVVESHRLRAVLRELVEGPVRTLHPGVIAVRVRREGTGAAVAIVHRQSRYAAPHEGRRRGTVLVHEGVASLGGRLWWSSEPGDGLRAALWVPDRRVVDGRVVGSALG